MKGWSHFHFWENPSIKEESNCYVLFQNWIRLGRGIISPASTIEISVEDTFILDAISQMGFNKEDIMKVNPSSYDLLEICSELKMFGFSIRYQKLLEKNTDGSQLPTGYFPRRGIRNNKNSNNF
jgi:hypothetical protein